MTASDRASFVSNLPRTGTKLSGQTDVIVRSSQGTDMSFLKQTSVIKTPTFL